MTRYLAAAVAVFLLAACGSSGGGETDKPTGAAADVSHALCTKDAAAKKVTPPAGFPSDFPMPPGTIVYAADDRGQDGIVVTGVTATPFRTTLKSLQTALPAAGFKPDEGEVEPHDAESDWSSSGYRGRWAIREIPQCSGETLVNVVARKNAG